MTGVARGDGGGVVVELDDSETLPGRGPGYVERIVWETVRTCEGCVGGEDEVGGGVFEE